jgi:hypothetical protein
MPTFVLSPRFLGFQSWVVASAIGASGSFAFVYAPEDVSQISRGFVQCPPRPATDLIQHKVSFFSLARFQGELWRFEAL